MTAGCGQLQKSPCPERPFKGTVFARVGKRSSTRAALLSLRGFSAALRWLAVCGRLLAVSFIGWKGREVEGGQAGQ